MDITGQIIRVKYDGSMITLNEEGKLQSEGKDFNLKEKQIVNVFH